MADLPNIEDLPFGKWLRKQRRKLDLDRQMTDDFAKAFTLLPTLYRDLRIQR